MMVGMKGESHNFSIIFSGVIFKKKRDGLFKCLIFLCFG